MLEVFKVKVGICCYCGLRCSFVNDVVVDVYIGVNTDDATALVDSCAIDTIGCAVVVDVVAAAVFSCCFCTGLFFVFFRLAVIVCY